MPTRWRPSTLLLLAALAACGRVPAPSYRPVSPHRAALGGARFEVVRLAQLFPGPYFSYQVTLRTAVAGATTWLAVVGGRVRHDLELADRPRDLRDAG